MADFHGGIQTTGGAGQGDFGTDRVDKVRMIQIEIVRERRACLDNMHMIQVFTGQGLIGIKQVCIGGKDGHGKAVQGMRLQKVVMIHEEYMGAGGQF